MVGDVYVMSRPLLPPQITASRLVVVARRLDPSKLEVLLELTSDNSVVVEVTMDAADAIHNIQRLRALGVTVGAGTVLTKDEAHAAIEAGATFLVSPLLDESLVSWVANEGVPMLAGAITPTEISRAWNAGAAAVKIFPASVAGPSLIRELRGPLGHIPLMPTGGIDASNAPQFLEAGAVAVGVGGWLTSGSPSLIVERWAELNRAIGGTK
jgi:2-dehydro-3-deoxyphosphogluconate aldolase/(4S)-4-hydroxy-2-oxoglutarate aldolase